MCSPQSDLPKTALLDNTTEQAILFYNLLGTYMKLQTVKQLSERIATAVQKTASHNPDPAVIATDADGTLWSGDVAVDTFWAMVRRNEVHEIGRIALCDKLEQLGFERPSTIHQAAKLLFDGYLSERIDEELACDMMMWVHTGLSQQQATEIVTEILHEENLVERIHPEMKAVVEWANDKRIPVYVVSASPRFVVQVGVKLLGIDPKNVIAASPIEQNGKLQPLLDEPMCYAHGKVLGLQRHLPRATIVAAFGDELFDLEMLQHAQIPVAVRPKDRLRKVANQIPGIVELLAD